MLPQVGIESRPLITSDSKSSTILSTLTWHLLARLRLWVPYIVMLYWFPLQVQHYPFYTNLTFACKTETLVSLYSHALLIPLKSSKSKFQVAHEQKFKDLLSSKCQVSVERRVLDLESEAMRGLGSIPTRGNIFF